MSRTWKIALSTVLLATLGALYFGVMGLPAAGKGPGETGKTTIVGSLKDPGPFDRAFQSADTVVIGTVKKLGPAVISSPPTLGQAEADMGIYTPVLLEVTEVFKGNVKPGEIVTFAQLGGKAGGHTIIYAGEAEFKEGEQVLVPLYKPTGAFKSWTGGNLHADQGKYLIDASGAATNEVRAETLPAESLKAKIKSALVSP
ncbi:MAG TPA: hypothetical protein VGL40_12405 [Bacillota bacterium]